MALLTFRTPGMWTAAHGDAKVLGVAGTRVTPRHCCVAIVRSEWTARSPPLTRLPDELSHSVLVYVAGALRRV